MTSKAGADWDEDETLDGKRRQIIEVMERQGKAMRSLDIARAVDINKSYLSQLLKKMAREGLVACVSYGMCYLPQDPNDTQVQHLL